MWGGGVWGRGCTPNPVLPNIPVQLLKKRVQGKYQTTSIVKTKFYERNRDYINGHVVVDCV
jgi:hypothetical protein